MEKPNQTNLTLKNQSMVAKTAERVATTLKWDPFIQEPPSELVTQTERRGIASKQLSNVDEGTSKTLEIDKSFLELNCG